MQQKDVDRLLRTYMPEKLWVTRIGNEVFRLELKPIVFNGAKTVRFRKVSMWRWFGLRVGFGMWLERIGKRIADGALKRKEQTDDQRRTDN